VRRSVAWALASLAVLAMAASAHAADITVTTTADAVVDDAQCSLREAVFATRAGAAIFGCSAGSGGVDAILLGPGTYDLEPGPGGPEDGNESGDLDSGPLNAFRVVGRGAGVTVIDALRGDRALDVFQNSSVSLESLTVTRGRSGPGGPGGAVRNQGTLTVLRASFEDNATGAGIEDLEAGGAGGAIWSGGPANPSVLVAETLFRGNATGAGAAARIEGISSFGAASGGAGGAIALVSGVAEVSATTFAGNRAGDGGAGATSPGGSAVSSGAGGSGGGIAVAGPASATAVNSTFAGNLAGGEGPESPFPGNMRGGGGGAAALTGTGGSLRISWSTFAGNARGARARGANAVEGGQVSASILADAAPACGGLLPPTLRNVVTPGDISCPPPRLEGDARLGPLGANGGPTPTLLPGAGSAAVDALVGVPCPGTDQRGLPRPRFGGCDAGAVEVQPGEPVAPSVAGGGAGAAAKARRLSALRLSPAAFRAAGSGGSIGALTKALQQRRPIGTTVRYTLDGAARVTFTITKPAAGRRVGRRCVKPAAARPGARRCVRTQKLKGSFVHQGVAGQNSFRFTGRLRRRALALGPYRLVARLPRPATGRAALAGKAFRIVR
jgi:CSLREA domain-containing protein